MKTLKLEISLENLKLGEEESKMTSPQLVAAVINNISLSWGSQKRGMQEDERRRYYKIADAFDKVLADGSTEIQLEDDWMAFIVKAKSEALLMPNELYKRVESLIDSAAAVK